MSDNIKVIGLKELQAAVRRNPQFVITEGKKVIVRGLALYKQTIFRQPWQVGQGGGGVPVGQKSGGNLRNSNLNQVSGLRGRIYVDQNRAPYALYVHEGTRFMRERPWLDYAVQKNKSGIKNLTDKFLKDIVGNLAK